MDKLIRPARIALFCIVICALAVLYIFTLYKLQIVEGEAYYKQSKENNISNEVVTAARGSIMDRYGRVLVTNRVCNNLMIDSDELFAQEDPNAEILRLCNMISEYGDTWTDDLPITMTSPFEYTAMTDIQRQLLDAYIDSAINYWKWEFSSKEPSAVELMAFIRWRYDIDPSYTGEEARKIAGVRYEVNIRYIIDTSEYIFAEDVSMELITTLMENNIAGIYVESSYVREYNTPYAAHILGYTGLMNSEELETYGPLGYANNARVGKDGAELAFEEYLHGTDGTARVTTTSTGVVTSTVYTTEPEPGNNVYLTLDIKLQEAAENALSSFITRTNAEREIKNAELDLYGGAEEDYEELITGAAVVAVDVKSGEPLAIASWPTYDLSTILENYAEIRDEENTPLFNRALQGIYAPGSTFKPLTTLAVLDAGIIEPTSTIDCEGRFRKYQDQGYAPACWIWNEGLGVHGEITATYALTVSCNYFFYYVGDLLGIDRMSEYAAQMGLGEATGIELPENTGVMSSQEYKETYIGESWVQGDTVQAGIGQAFTLLTPIQISEYCAAIANNGVRHSASILKSVRSFDFSETIYQRETEVLSALETEQEYYDIVHQGMYGVANDHKNSTTVTETFMTANYEVAAKTGTAQIGEGTTNAVFMCYAPYDDPEIAVCVTVEKGASGASIATIAREVLDYYFNFANGTGSLEGEGVLLK